MGRSITPTEPNGDEEAATEYPRRAQIVRAMLREQKTLEDRRALRRHPNQASVRVLGRGCLPVVPTCVALYPTPQIGDCAKGSADPREPSRAKNR